MKALCIIACLLTFSNIGNASIKGTKRFTPVLDGVMYFGGGKQEGRANMNPLQDATLERLCTNGFSESIYLYNKNFKPKNISCSQGGLEYDHIDWRKTDKILKRIYDIAVSGAGPIYIHCWNGLHASNAVAAISLMQFCNWDKEKAQAYWLKNAGERNFNKFRGVGKRIRNFTRIPGLALPKNIENNICPN